MGLVRSDPTVIVVEVTTPEQLALAYAIRRRVFIEEQGVPEDIEMDADDLRAFHALAVEDSEAVGCGRMVEHGDEVKIGRMAVLRKRRRSGVGRCILEFLVDTARHRGFRRAVLHAQLSAEGFYLANGFKANGEVFEEAGIAHRRMERTL
jgi:predicted GNAT family N-acyltransferase